MERDGSWPGPGNTVEPAIFTGENQSGTNKAGKPADLVILDVHSVAAVRNVRRIRTLAIGGKILKRGDLYAAANRVAKAVRAGLDGALVLPGK